MSFQDGDAIIMHNDIDIGLAIEEMEAAVCFSSPLWPKQTQVVSCVANGIDSACTSRTCA